MAETRTKTQSNTCPKKTGHVAPLHIIYNAFESRLRSTMRHSDATRALWHWMTRMPGYSTTGPLLHTNWNGSTRQRMTARGEVSRRLFCYPCTKEPRCNPNVGSYGQNMDTSNPHHRRRAICLDPAFKKAWMRRGMVRHSRGKYAGSVADFSEALLLDPSDNHAKKLREHSAAKEREVLLTT